MEAVLFIMLVTLGLCAIGFASIGVKLWSDSFSEWALRKPIRVCSLLFFTMTVAVIWCMAELAKAMVL